MTITQLIDKLTKVRNKYGDIEVVSYNEPFLRHSADAPEETRPVALQVKDAYPDERSALVASLPLLWLIPPSSSCVNNTGRRLVPPFAPNADTASPSLPTWKAPTTSTHERISSMNHNTIRARLYRLVDMVAEIPGHDYPNRIAAAYRTNELRKYARKTRQLIDEAAVRNIRASGDLSNDPIDVERLGLP